MKDKSTPEDYESMLKKIDGCSDADISNISNWLEAENNKGYALLTDDKIITLKITEENEDDIDENIIISDDRSKVISHNEAMSDLGQLMVYFECQVETTLNELLLLKQICNRAARKQYTKLAQQKIRNFIITK